MLSDQEFSDEMKEAEYDLIEDYHHQRLTPQERTRAEAAFGKRSLAQHIPGAGEIPRNKSRAIARRARLSLLAAAMLLIAFSAWLTASRFWKTASPSHTLAQAPANPSASRASPPPATPKGVPRNSTAVLLLVSGVSRGPDATTLYLHRATKNILVQWVVPGHLKQDNFLLVLRQNRTTLAAVPQRKPLKSVDGSSIAEFDLPAALLWSKHRSQALILIRSTSANKSVLDEFPIQIIRESEKETANTPAKTP